MRDLLDKVPDRAMTAAERRQLFGPGRGSAGPKGYAGTPGQGPAGETCRSCEHCARVRHARIYLKCALMRTWWTGGPATDIRARSPACERWQAIGEPARER